MANLTRRGLLMAYHVAVVSRLHVIDKLKAILAPELKKLSKAISRDQSEILEELYELSDGKPCFIRCKAGVKSIKLSYYDSVRFNDKKKTIGCSIFEPIVEKRINYTYRTLAPVSNCWFYVRSPKDFHISVNDIPSDDKVEIEQSASQDPEIKSMVIKGKKQRQNIFFSIDVVVPDGLKWWYNAIYAVSITAVLFAVFLIGMHWLFPEPVSWIEQLIKNAGKGWFAIVAALITTRGWLMHEAHAFNRLSKSFTLFVVILLVEAFVLAGLHEKKPQEKAIQDVNKEMSATTKTATDSCSSTKDSIVMPKVAQPVTLPQTKMNSNDK